MLIEDAQLHLPVREGEEIEDRYLDLLFEQKKYFLSSIPWTKSFKARFKRLDKIHEAYLLLSRTEVEPINNSFDFQQYESDSLRDIITTYQNNRSLILHHINSANNIPELKYYAEQLLKNLCTYAERWPSFEDEVDSSVGIKFPDPVLVMKALADFEQRNNLEIRELNRDDMLYEEWFQLSLWLSKEHNGR